MICINYNQFTTAILTSRQIKGNTETSFRHPHNGSIDVKTSCFNKI